MSGAYDAAMTARLSIGLVARRSDCTVPTIRYYEDIGLLPPARRTEGGQRHYDEASVRRLSFIRRCRDFGFSIEQVRELVGLVDQPERPCAEVRDIAALHLQQVRQRLQELQALEAELGVLVVACEARCAGGPAIDCTILEDLRLPQREGQEVSPRGCCAA